SGPPRQVEVASTGGAESLSRAGGLGLVVVWPLVGVAASGGLAVWFRRRSSWCRRRQVHCGGRSFVLSGVGQEPRLGWLIGQISRSTDPESRSVDGRGWNDQSQLVYQIPLIYRRVHERGCRIGDQGTVPFPSGCTSVAVASAERAGPQRSSGP